MLTDTDRPPQPAICEAHRQGLRDVLARASRLLTMTQTPGWKEIFEPMLRQRRKAKVEELIGEDDHDKAFRLQVSIREINAILGFVDTTIKLAESAQESLDAEHNNRPGCK